MSKNKSGIGSVSGNDNDRYVTRRPAGDKPWAVTGEGADRASGLFRTQAEAERRAKEIVSNLGGGEVRIQGRDGRFRDSDTVGRPDPSPPRHRKY